VVNQCKERAMFLCEILTEQQQQVLPPSVVPTGQAVPQQVVAQPASQSIPQSDMGYDEYDPELDAGEGEAVQEVPPFQEILPMKKYYLVQRLRNLKSTLDQNDIQNQDFDIIMKFVNNVSYDSLVSLSNGIIPVIEDQLARLQTNA